MLGTSGGVGPTQLFFEMIINRYSISILYEATPVFPSISFSGLLESFHKSKAPTRVFHLDMTCEATKVIQLG